MLSTVSNRYAEATINNLGAELISLKLLSCNIEFMWNVNEKIWERHSPVLFPIVGKLKDDFYKFNGNSYKLNQHGFARDSKFKISKKGKDLITYSLQYDNDSLNMFPFMFKLEITYLLERNRLTISYKIYNIDSKTMWFSIGAHPGLKCPFSRHEKFTDYYIEFEKEERAFRYFLENSLLSGKREMILDNAKILQLDPVLFRDDAIILKDLKSKSLSLKSMSSPHKITVDLGNFPYLGLWMKPEFPFFICIEPWFGLADKHDCSGLLQEKEGILSLEPAKSFECSYSIIIE
ncbi:MAG: aldose 1-epimerase family protein [Candidatus Aureabacteria bacterium]|nr:aldose 1-epimerase family protein [Candidatus Auribacterota bacterium]